MLQGSWRTAHLQAVDHSLEPDDDISLYRLFGFALFVSIRYRKRVIDSRLKRTATVQRRQLYRTHIKMLEALVETDKTTLPACISFQDRGKMRFPYSNLLPFCRDCSIAIKTYLNPTLFQQLGRQTVIVSTH